MTARKPSIVNGELVRCSVSQIKTADESQDGGCLRRWAFQKIDHIEEPGSKAMEESTKGHTIAETFIREDFLPAGNNAIERAFLAGKFMIPDRSEIEPEREFDGQISLAGVPFNGKVDAWSKSIKTDGIITWATVRDHKFLRTLEKAKNGDQMERDVQMVGYGMVVLTEHPEINHVDLGHWNYQKEEPRDVPGRCINRMVPVATIKERWHRFEALVERMKEAARLGEAARVPGNKKACYAFGKKYACPHVERCAKIGNVKEKTMEWSAEEMALFGGAKKETVTEAGALGTGEKPVPQPSVRSLIMPDCSCGVSLTPENSSQLADGSFKHIGCMKEVTERLINSLDGSMMSFPGILPPDAPKSDPELAAACPKCEDSDKNFQHKPADCPKKDGEAKAKGKRGRPRKDPNEASKFYEEEAQSARKLEEDLKPGDVITAPGVGTVKVSSVVQDEIVCAPASRKDVSDAMDLMEAGSKRPTVAVVPSPMPFDVLDKLSNLRDEFAKAALIGMAAQPSNDLSYKHIAKVCYSLADAMLAARGEK